MTPTNEKTEVVSFRAPPDLLRQIDEARKPFDAGRGEWVRGVVTAHLYAANGPAYEMLTESVEHLMNELAETRKDFWRGLLVTLIHTGGLTQEEAADLVKPYITS